jgi:hypothetical protein
MRMEGVAIMFFSGIFSGEPRYIRRARACLQEARMAMLEHSMAAEHYHASAAMYAERARRLEEEIAHWEARKKGAVLMDPLQDAGKYIAPNRIESVPAAAAAGAAPTVGIVRAA